ncbi:MAG: hypothetical protein RL570_765 [Actinomycetota bacterium]
MQLTDIQITPELKGVIAVPDRQGPWPAVVMVHEIFGIDDAMRSQITRMAQAGYVVLMPDLFSRGGARKCLTATFKALTNGAGQAFIDVEDAKKLLLARPDTTKKVGAGMMPKNVDAALEGACPIVGSFGAKDKQLAGATKTLQQVLTKKEIAHDIKEYPDTGHAFMNPHQAGGPVFGTLLRITGAKPNPEAAADAWQRIERFFGEHLS